MHVQFHHRICLHFQFLTGAQCLGMALALFILAAGQVLGQPTNALAVAPAQVQFPTSQVGSVTAPSSVTITNTSTKTVSGISISVSGDFSEKTTCRASLKAGASCQASLTFAPSAGGLRSGNLTVAYTGQSAPAVASLTGMGFALTSISIAPQTASIPVGAGRPFHAIAAFSDGSAQDITASAAWSSSDTTKVIVSNGGMATGVAVGSTQVTATSNGVVSSVNVTVTSATLVSLAVNATHLNLPQGYAQQFNAVGSYSDGTQLVLTNQVAWTSSAPAVASVSPAGLAITLSAGTSLVTAALGPVTASAPITVSGVTLESIAVSPATVSMARNTILQLQATGTYSDGSTRSLTNLVNWSSSANNTATVSAIGRIASEGQPGPATISAVFAGVTVSVPATVTAAHLKSIAVTPGKPSMPAGVTQPFKATGTFSDSSTQDVTLLVHWTSSAPTLVTIANTLQSEGLASSTAVGSSTITASYLPSVAGRAALTVDTAALVSIAITPANVAAPAGSAFQFNAAGTFSDQTTRNLTQSVTWSSANPASLLVANDPGSQGFGYGLAAGQNTVIATLGSITGSTPFAVAAPNLITISVSPQTAAVVAGATQQFTATGTYGDGSTQDLTASATWSSSAPTAATVGSSAGSDGLALGVAQGQATIMAASGSILGSGQLTVSPPQLVSIAVNPANPTIAAGGSQQFAAIGTFTDGSTQDLTAKATWSASPATAATIGNAAGSHGLAQGVAPGQSTITATSGAINGSTVLTVNPAPPQLDSISISPSSATIFMGLTQQFTATGNYSDGSTQDLTATATWSANPIAVAAIGNSPGGQGLAQALASGSATITAVSGAISATAQLSIVPLLISITVSPSSASIVTGGTQQFTATGGYSDGTSQDLTATATWSASPTSVATIGNAPGSPGLAQAVAPGSAAIAASFAATTGGTTLTVTPALVSIAVTPANPSILTGASQQFAATGTYSDNSTQDLTNQATWSAAPSPIAAIGPGGLAQALTSGQTTITAALGAVSNSTVLTVSLPPTLVSVAISPLAPTVPVGGLEQFYATGTYSDGSTQDLTAAATWSSLSPTVASIGTSGLATGLAAGITTIGATAGGLTALATPFWVVGGTPSGAYGPAPTGLPPLPATVVLPQLPQSVPNPVFPTVTGNTLVVTSASQLQSALNTAPCGGAVQIQPGTYVGNYTFSQVCPPGSPILIYGSNISSFPAGTRMPESAAGTIPTLTTANNEAPLVIGNGASGVYIAGIAFTTATPIPVGVYPIVDMGGGNVTTIAGLPSNITFDRVLIYAPNPPGINGPFVQRGLTLNCVNCSLINSSIWNIVNTGQDTQAVAMDNTPGPVLIWNNYLEASGENVMLNTKECQTGYCASGIPNVIPSDVTVERNHFYKQPAWISQPAGCVIAGEPQCYDVKNLFEIKHGQRVLLDSNLLDTTFAQAQAEAIISNCFKTGPYVCGDFTVTSNLIQHAPQVAAIAGNGDNQTGQRILFRNNLAIDISGVNWGGAGISMQVQNTNSLTVDHNTIVNQPPTYINGLNFSDNPPSTDVDFQWSNNIQYGSPFADATTPGSTLAELPNPVIANTAFVGDYWPDLSQLWNEYGTPVYLPSWKVYTPRSSATPVAGQPGCSWNNKPMLVCWPLDWATVGFLDFNGGNAGTDLPGLALSPSSLYHASGSDGLDIGANIAAVLAATAGVQ